MVCRQNYQRDGPVSIRIFSFDRQNEAGSFGRICLSFIHIRTTLDPSTMPGTKPPVHVRVPPSGSQPAGRCRLRPPRLGRRAPDARSGWAARTRRRAAAVEHGSRAGPGTVGAGYSTSGPARLGSTTGAGRFHRPRLGAGMGRRLRSPTRPVQGAGRGEGGTGRAADT